VHGAGQHRDYVPLMRVGNILAAAGIITGFIGFICLPLWNLHELPYAGDPAYPKGGGWIFFVQTGILARPGIILMIAGGAIYLFAKLLPKKHWQTADDLLEEEIRKDYNRKKNE
jgi:hypothetical protein